MSESSRPLQPERWRALHGLIIWRWKLHWQILLGMAIGAVIGWRIGEAAVAQLPVTIDSDLAGAAALDIVRQSAPWLILNLVADLFLNGLLLIVVPLVTSSIILAVARIGSSSAFGRLGLKTLLYYLTTSTLAVLVGLTLVNVLQPGLDREGRGILVGRDLGAFHAAQEQIQQQVGDRGLWDFLNVFRQMIPPNLFDAAASGNLLGLIVVSLFIGFFLARMNNEAGRAITVLAEGVYAITMKITALVLTLAPIGVMALLARTIAEQYAALVPDDRFADFLAGIAQFAFVGFVGLMVHLLVVLPLILLALGRVAPWRHYRAMLPAMTTAFSTASSAATLPLTMECVEERAGVSRKTASFVLPLGATVNMDGTALYECVAAIFICQAFGIELTFAQQFLIVVVALITSIGVAGVPAAALVAIVVILQAVQNSLPPGALPEGVTLLAGMGLLFVFERPLDMMRTMINIFSDSCGAVVIARSEGETDILADPPRASNA